MNNTELLFENMMTYKESNEQTTGKIKSLTETDTTLINLGIEIPTDTTDIQPEDVEVNVGTTELETDEPLPELHFDDEEEVSNDEIENEDETEDDVPDDEIVDNEEAIEETEESVEPSNKKCDDTNKECDDTKKSVKPLHKSSRIEASRAEFLSKLKDAQDSKKMAMHRQKTNESKVEPKLRNRHRKFESKAPLKRRPSKVRVESKLNLDNIGLAKLFKQFITENYTNINRVTINKAKATNNSLYVEGTLFDKSGNKSLFALKNEGFNVKKCEGKTFIMDFKDVSNTFKVVKESKSTVAPFTCKASVKHGLITFESLSCDFKTKYNESTMAQVKGKYTLTESASKKDK